VAVSVNEVKLVERATAGDHESFARLYTDYLDAIYRYIYYRTGDAQDAEDLTEQVFIKAWKALPNYRQVGELFGNWLYRIAHNIIVDYHRRRKTISSETIEQDAVLPDPAQENALDTIISAEESALLARSIARLPDEYQQIIILRFIEGLGHAEIATILDKSEVACRGLQHRALISLNRLLSVQKEGI
jgi:RNA polymerase sigma-70 factor, ECF subfamily